jgi:hypothetical protein
MQTDGRTDGQTHKRRSDRQRQTVRQTDRDRQTDRLDEVNIRFSQFCGSAQKSTFSSQVDLCPLQGFENSEYFPTPDLIL